MINVDKWYSDQEMEEFAVNCILCKNKYDFWKMVTPYIILDCLDCNLSLLCSVEQDLFRFDRLRLGNIRWERTEETIHVFDGTRLIKNLETRKLDIEQIKLSALLI